MILNHVLADASVSLSKWVEVLVLSRIFVYMDLLGVDMEWQVTWGEKERESVFLDLHLENMESLGDPQNSERWKGLQNGDSAHSDLDLKHLQLSLAAQYLINLKKNCSLFQSTFKPSGISFTQE